ncbi:hypothetical protein J3Q64DRAFT_1695566 [Phycomyces blakesleeanus]|uniref:Uncharacterized protein n=1 Tax=Phycomyces blakesleeanus TaxID=4837 RepID=A0ABR3B5Z7_PHYBL
MCLNVSLKVIRCAALFQAQTAGERMACELNFAQIFAVFQLFFAHYKNSQIMLVISLVLVIVRLARNISICIYMDSLPASLSLHTIICFSIYYVSERQWNLGSFSSQVNFGRASDEGQVKAKHQSKGGLVVVA